MSWSMDAQALFAPWLECPARPVTGMTLDSRQAQSGDVFFALAGTQQHGITFLEQALAAGVSVVAWEVAEGLDPAQIAARCQAQDAISLPVIDLTAKVSAMAARFYGEPAQAMRIIGVTGTDGKTSVAHYLVQLLEALQGDAAVLGTVGWGRPEALSASTHTTADAVTLQQSLAMLRNDGVRSVVMEVSSHALAQHRVDAVPFDTAILTYVGRDHLDYHGTLEAYHAAKRRLFAWPSLRRQVLNLDDAIGADLAAQAREGLETVGYGGQARADLQISAVQTRVDGLEIALRYQARTHAVHLPLVGRFNAMNATAALGAVLDEQPIENALQALSRLRPVPGRMERFVTGIGPLAVVDYAHTPGALEAVLLALREHTRGRLWCVFGCGGERDPGKRPIMGAVASQNADVVVLTSDNPRAEEPSEIIAQIQSGCIDATDCRVIEQRGAAIEEALSAAAADDVVLIAGKGHEREQVIAGTAYPFSDRAVVLGWQQRRAG